MKKTMPRSGEFYRDFKGKIYQIKMLAKDSETQKLQVVYQEMYPPFQCWIRPLEVFFSPVDHEKYPEIKQAMCFEQVDADELLAQCRMGDGLWNKTQELEQGVGDDAGQDANKNIVKAVDDTTLIRALESGQPERYLSGKITDQEIAERGCMKILDAETFREKRQLMVGMKPYFDKRLLHNIAAALDIVLEEGDLESQYDSLLHCIDTMEHFEGGRLR